ncbi:MAG: phosphoribosyltransferase [Lysobacterales bacterium]
MNIRLPFADRTAAAHLLARALDEYRGYRPLVLALPRGGVPIGQIVARELGGDLDMVQARKIGAPSNPELAIGAVAENGWRFVFDSTADMDISAAQIDALAERELALMRERRVAWVQGRVPPEVRGRLVLVVDDGIATGATMIAAIESLLPQKPERLICATPIASRDCLSRLREITHDLVYLAAPEDFRAVGQYYIDFRPVEDVEVKAMLAPFAISGKSG